MKALASSGAVLAATLAWLCLLFAIRPFDRLNASLDRLFGALPAWTQVENLYQDPAIQEVSRGDHPLHSFQVLANNWARHSLASRVMLMGNSQTQAVSLAPGEPPPFEPEKTYSDLISDRFRVEGNREVLYRLSAGALSYEEMLWYATYFTNKPLIKPTLVLVQLNYQNFANGNIRQGMLEMLTDVGFRKDIERICRQNRSYSGGFREALHSFEEVQAHASQRNAMERTSAQDTPGLGYSLETRIREALDQIPGFQQRGDARQAAVLMLLRCRSYFLRLQQATPRSLRGPRIEASRRALEALVDCLRRANIQVILFEAPTNPKVPLYRTIDDDRDYHTFVNQLAACHNLTVLDFEHSIPAEDWGMALNAPDPLHLGRAGHHLLSELIAARLGDSRVTVNQGGS